jgi:hypothetical protein
MRDFGWRGGPPGFHLVFSLALLAGALTAGCGGGAAEVGAGAGTNTGADAGPDSGPTMGCTDPMMIDDMEDDDSFICKSGGRQGEWFAVGDGTSTNLFPNGTFTQSMIPGGRGSSLFAAEVKGAGFTDWGAAMGFHLNEVGSTVAPYDASTTGGIKFWMKSNVPVTMNLAIPATLAMSEAGGTCVDGAGQANCDNHLAFSITAPPADAWVEYQVPYAATQQSFYRFDAEGNPTFGDLSFDPSKLVNVQFNVNPNVSFAVWIDDISFYDCAGTTCIPTCSDPSAPVACPARSNAAAGCWPAGTDCSKVISLGLEAVWGSGSSDVWAVGGEGPEGSHSAVVHWNGTSWSGVSTGTTHPLTDVWGSGAADVWAIGTNGTAVHWNGSAWSASVSGTTYPLYGIWGSGPTDVWAVGAGGTIIHWNGTAWSTTPTGMTDTLINVRGSGPSDVWAVGYSATNAGSVLHWNGTTWSAVPNVSAMALFGVWESGPSDVWAVGNQGTTVHWNGTAWSTVPSGTTQYLVRVWGSGSGDVWTVGNGGALLHWTGTAWSSVVAPTTSALSGVWGSAAGDVWTVGDAALGSVFHWNGSGWSSVSIGPLL